MSWSWRNAAFVQLAAGVCCLLRVEAFLSIHGMAQNYRASPGPLPHPSRNMLRTPMHSTCTRRAPPTTRCCSSTAGTSTNISADRNSSGYTSRSYFAMRWPSPMGRKSIPGPRRIMQGWFSVNRCDDLCRASLVVRRSSEGEWQGGAAAGGGGGEDNALLLRMEFEGTEVEELRGWIRRYPFGTALPVQPFSLVETEAGVDVVFRKKPTLERGSQDGGLSFVVEDVASREGVDLPAGLTLVLRRISKGQAIRKMFAERIVVKAIVKSLAGEGGPPAPDGTKVRAVLHKGLV